MTGPPPGLGAPDVLAAVVAHGRTHPGAPAVRDSEQSLTYGELCDAAATVANGLSTLGVGHGDRVALRLGNSIGFVVAALATMWTGAAFVPLAEEDPSSRLAASIADCAPVVVVDSGDGAVGDRPHSTLAALSSSASTDWPPVPTDQRIAYLIYTSGTTGKPKGVVIGTAAFAAAVDAIVGALGLSADTRTLCVSPFHFDGSFATLFPTLREGGTVVLRRRDALLFPRTFLRAVVDEAITYTGFSPSYLRMILGDKHAGVLAGSDLDVVALGGEASTPADVRALGSMAPRVRIFNRYGPTECTIAVTHLEVTQDVLGRRTVPLGRPHAGVSFHLVDEGGHVIEESEAVGELHVGGVQLMDGYWAAPELTADVLRTDLVAGETLYRTGDLVTREKGGLYVYVGRADRVVKRHGVRISLVEVDEALAGLPGVSVARCATYDDAGVTRIAAFVVGDDPIEPAALRTAAHLVLPAAMLPDRIVVADALPLTPSGKLDDRALLTAAGLSPCREDGGAGLS